MSTRRLLDLITGSLGLLAAVAVVIALTGGSDGADAERIEVTVRQQSLLQDLRSAAQDLADGQDLATVNEARARLGQGVLAFDRNLTALVAGGPVTTAGGEVVELPPPGDGDARRALTSAADLWLRTGLPLADLAGGAFSVYSAAGQAAVRGLQDAELELIQHLGAAANALADARDSGRMSRAWARGGAVGLVLLLAAFVLIRRFLDKARTAGTAVETASAAPMPAAVDTVPAAPPAARPVARPLAPAAPVRPYTPPVDLEDLTVSVDQMTVDLQNIASNSDKMRLAIDSVGHALQGMLYSLNEMAQDTADGDRMVRGADSAARYTAEVASALAESVREMSGVVANVTQLANRTRQTASRVESEAVPGERSGKGFTLAVSNELRGLAGRTAVATSEIERTVAEMLGRTREYEEAVGQIIKHVSSINRVSSALGQLMLDPPPPDVVPAPTAIPLEPGITADAEPAADEFSAPGEPAPEAVDDAVDHQSMIDDTEAAIAEATEVLVETAADAPEEPVPVEEPAGEDAADTAETAEAPGDDAVVPEQPVAKFSLGTEGATPPAPANTTASPTVFMLNRPSTDAEESRETDEEAVEAAGPEEEPAVAGETAAQEEPAAEEPEETVVAEPAAPAAEPTTAETGSPNIFMLNMPAKPPVGETVPPDADED